MKSTRTFAAATAVVAATVLTLTAHGASALPAERTTASTTTPPAATPASRGLILRGLHKATAGRCHGGYDVVGHAGLCSPGPDAAPDTVDVRSTRSGGTTTTKTGGGKTKTAPSPSPSPSPTTAPTTPTSGRCGTDGPRVQAVYAVSSDVPDAFDSLQPSLQQWLSVVDGVYNSSAAETGGVRHVRFVTDAACVPTILKVVMSPTGDDSFSDTITELQNAGLNRTDRKYVVWVDSNLYCGIGNVKGDDTPGATNSNNYGPSYGRTDRGCWGGWTEAHELMHNLGGVQLSAPHSTGAWHCTDEYDRMCYRENNATMLYLCPQEHDNVFDCNHDDYYSTNPPAGSYLADHWNAANSVFLSTS
jgi:hypothetical protein